MRSTARLKRPNGRSKRGRSGIELMNVPAGPTRRAGEMVGGRYRIERRLGSGSTSDVFLSIDTTEGRPVVVKQLTTQAQDNDELRTRFLVEAQALSKMRHPNIVQFLDFAAPDVERPYLVMEALQGETLARLLSRRREIPLETTRLIVQKTAEGLLHAHGASVIHRDIKPDNLFLLGPKDAPFNVKVIDFGMAKIPRSCGSSGVHTVLGTLEYMSPEQVMADPVDDRTDIYALGIVLFRLLTGELPFDTEDRLELISHQLFSPTPLLTSVRPDLPIPLERLIEKATRKDPGNRHQTMQEFLADFEYALGPSSDVPTPTEEGFDEPVAFEPDAYEPRNPEGREAAVALAERYPELVERASLPPEARRSNTSLRPPEPDAPSTNDLNLGPR